MDRYPVRFIAATVAVALATACSVSFGRGLHPQAAPLSVPGLDRPLIPRALERPDVGAEGDPPPALQKGLDVMRRHLLATATPLAVSLGLLLGAPTGVLQQLEAQSQDRPVVRRRAPSGERTNTLAFVRTELFFGTAKPVGAVTAEEFRTFLDTVITPRFPDGLTVIRGKGQFTGQDGVLIKEDSYTVVLLYPVEGQKASSQRIDEIRRAYMRQHQQESVLRVDDPYLVWVSF